MLARISASTTFRPLTAISISRRYAYVNEQPVSRNQGLVELLQSEVENEKRMNTDEHGKNLPPASRYRIRSLQNAIHVISKLDFEITSTAAVRNIDGIGVGVTKRIREYLAGTHSSQPAKDEETLVAELESLPGIGRKRAEKLAAAGCRGMDDLQLEKYLNMLTPAQRVALRYAAHLERPATREQTEIVTDFIRENISPKYEIVPVGSYRLNAPESKSIKVMLFHPDHVHIPVPPVPLRGSYTPYIKPVAVSAKSKDEAPIHKLVVPVLQERGLLAQTTGIGVRYFNGLARIPERDSEGRWQPRRERLAAIKEGAGTYRRTNLYMMPVKSRGAALIYHTGDAQMKKLLKHKAEKLGLYLDELGLWKWHPDEREGEGAGELSSGFWQLLNSTTEEAIFEQLGVDYVEPHRRNLAQVR
ncbi:hypothetical protein LshimejAT787_0504920 [Lyophyllum shimeji]|uniref:DNA polymerase n=1 Tax=Lyophyllum shimeji TaxID=47721 RepID=A0A9P3PNN5_LYOSH|nr:hypothetical protein LshimejAT787_0504920 [Lyophyllum shimeji]